MLIDVATLFTIANFIGLISTLLMIRSILKKKKVDGFGWFSCFLTLITITLIDVGYIGLGFYIPLLLSLPTDVLWSLIFIYTIKSRSKQKTVRFK
jgi:hypothetical protein